MLNFIRDTGRAHRTLKVTAVSAAGIEGGEARSTCFSAGSAFQPSADCGHRARFKWDTMTNANASALFDLARRVRKS